MRENRKNKFYLEKTGDFAAFEQKVKGISGVLSASVDVSISVLTYELDDLASDYDAFAAVVQAAEDTGCVIDFEKTDEENAKAAESGSAGENPTENKAGELSEPLEEAEAFARESVYERADFVKNDNKSGGAESGENGENYEDADGKSEKSKKHRKRLSETAQCLIELGIGIVALIIGHFVNNDYGKMFMFALAFAVSGYELIYDVICDVTAKRIFTPELLVILGIAASLFLGYPEQAVAVTLIFFAAKIAARGLKSFALGKTAAKNIDERYTILIKKDKKTKEKETRLIDINAGDELSFKKGEICPLEATLTSPLSTVLRTAAVFENGETQPQTSERELKKGDKILKGDEFLSDSTACVKSGFLSGLSVRQKDFISRVEEKNEIEKFFDKKGNLVCGIAIILLLAVTFVAPVFSVTYLSGLYRWGYAMATVAVLCGAALTVSASSIAGIVSLAIGYDKGVMAFKQKDCVKAEKCKTVAFDFENTLLKDGEIKPDAFGAALELKDCGKRLALLTLLPGEEAKETCKKLKISEYYCFNTEEEKLEKIKELQAENVLCITTAGKAEDYFIALSAGKDLEVNAAAYVESDEIAFVPYVYKLALKAAKSKKFALWFSVCVKAVLAVLAAFGITQIWWVACADLLAGVICLTAAVIGIKEVI